MNYLKYLNIIIKAKINKKIQLKYIIINKNYKSVLIRNYGELYLAYFYNNVWIRIDKYLAQDKKVLLKVVSYLIKQNKKIYLVEEVKAFTDEDIKYLYSLSGNIFIKQMYMDKSKALAGNQILLTDISSYMLILEKLDYFEKVCNKYFKTDFDKALFTIVELSDYVTYQLPSTKETSCLTNALLLKYGVCIDFSIALWKCLERLNIECLIIKGLGNENNVRNKLLLFNHAWNQVKIDNKWYNIDLTWLNTLKETKYLFANDDIFYSEGRHKTRFETKTCLENINQDDIKEKIEEIRKFMNVFEQYDNGNKETELINKQNI